LEVFMNNAQIVHAVQAANYSHQLLSRSVRGWMSSRDRVCKGMSTSFNLPTLGSFLRYCLRLRPSMYS